MTYEKPVYQEPVYRPELKRSLMTHFARELGTYPYMDATLIAVLDVWFDGHSGRVSTEFLAGAIARSYGKSESETDKYVSRVQKTIETWQLGNIVQDYLRELQQLQGTPSWELWGIHDDLLLIES